MRKPYKNAWTQKEDDILKTNYPVGGVKICESLLNRTKATIFVRASKLKLKSPKEFAITKIQANQIINRIKTEKIGLEQICKSYNISSSILSRAIKDHYPNINFYNLKNANNLDHNYFDEIGPNQAYFIGLIFSDGYIRHTKKGQKQIVIELQIKDKYILDQFSKELKMDRMPRINKQRFKLGMKNIQQTTTFIVSSNKLVDRLKELGIGPNKSLTIRIPDLFLENENLFWHFFRGVFDGDGTIGSTKGTKTTKKYFKLSVTGNKFSCQDFSSLLLTKFNLGSGNICNPHGNTYTFCIGGNIQIKKLYYLLYKNADFFLIRKHNKFSECLIQDGLQPLF